MRLLVGLGNPGPKYARNRHNIGFLAMDAIAARHGFPPFRQRFQGELSEGRLGSQRIALLKPLTYMNESGRAVGAARSEEHTSELQSLRRISYAVFRLTKKKK